jgi:hypothetical protein
VRSGACLRYLCMRRNRTLPTGGWRGSFGSDCFGSVGRGPRDRSAGARTSGGSWVAPDAFFPQLAFLEVEPGRIESDADHQIEQFVDVFPQRVPGPLRFEFGALVGAVLAFAGVVFGGQPSGFSAADVFSDDAAVDACGSCVVAPALVPAHFCYTSTNARSDREPFS